MSDIDSIKASIGRWRKGEGGQPSIGTPFGDIPLGKTLGEGGTGIVYSSSAYDNIAIKLLADPITSPTTGRHRRFLDEYWRTVTLPHNDFVIKMYHYGELAFENLRLPYILMERCRETIDSQYKKEPLRSAAEFQALLERLLSALDFIHANGIVHRDVKPKNILRRKDNTIVLSDFGIQWFNDELVPRQANTLTGDRLANFEFSPLDQAKMSSKDAPSPNMDLYALGQTLYYCVTTNTIRGTGHKRMGEVSSELSQFDDMIEKMVANEPSDRFQSVKDVWAHLEKKKHDSTRNVWYEEQRNLYEKMLRQTREFGSRISRTRLAPFEFTRLTNPDDISTILASIATNCESYELWWRCTCLQPAAPPDFENQYLDDPDGPVRDFRRLDKSTWLINGNEIQVAEACICRSKSDPWRQFVLLQLKPMAPFFGKLDESSGVRCADYAGFAQERYIPDDLYNSLDEVVKYEGDEVDLTAPDSGHRIRYLKTALMFLAPHLSVIYESNYSAIFREVVAAILKSGKVDEAALAAFYGKANGLPPLPDYIVVNA